MNAADKLIKARTGLVLDMPFFGALALRLSLHRNDGQPTMRTDGSIVQYNEKFVDDLSLGDVKGVLCHEVLHCASGHHLRMGSRNAKKWNRACDYVVNGILDAAKIQLPKSGLLDHKYDGLSADAVYAQLPDESGDGNADGEGAGMGDVVTPKNGDQPLNEAEVEQQLADWKVAVAQAAQQARNMGQLPAALDRFADEVVAARVDWRETLRRFIQQNARNDYRWTPPNRRHVHAGLYLPSLRGEELPPIAGGFDTSGSTQGYYEQFAGEMTSILEEYDTEFHAAYCDAKVQNVEVFTREDLPLQLHPRGGGGTDFRPVFDWIAEQDWQPCCLVYLTDMHGIFPDKAPDYPVLWVSTSAVDTAPFGEVVKI